MRIFKDMQQRRTILALTRQPLTALLALAWLVLAGLPASAEAAQAVEADQDLQAFSGRLNELAEPCRQATVGIVIPGGSMGSGVIVREDGLILTAAHVLPKDGTPIVIVLADGTQLRGESLGQNARVDSAMARITEPGKYPHTPIADPNTVWEGDWCVAFGHGGGVQTDRPAPMRLGRILHVSSNTSETRWLTTDTTVISGDSGGPLFNLDGQVIGIHSNIGMSVLVNRHVPISAYHAQWDQLAEPGNQFTQTPPVAEPVLPGLEALPDALERELARRLKQGDQELRQQLEQMRDDDGRIALAPEQAAKLFNRDDLLDELRAFQQKVDERRKMTEKIQDADAGGAADDGEESAVSRQSRKTRMLILEKKRERMLGDIAQDLRKTHGKIAEHVLGRFAPATDLAGPCVGEVVCRGGVVALATVVRSDGYLVTKASELVGPPRVRINGNEYRAKVVNGNGPSDLVLLKVEATDLTPVRWASSNPAVGSLLVSPSAQGKPLSLSVVGVDARAIPQSVNNLKIDPPARPYLGVGKLETSEDPEGVRIRQVAEDTPAADAGLKPGDTITAIDGQPVADIPSLIQASARPKPDRRSPSPSNAATRRSSLKPRSPNAPRQNRPSRRSRTTTADPPLRPSAPAAGR